MSESRKVLVQIINLSEMILSEWDKSEIDFLSRITRITSISNSMHFVTSTTFEVAGKARQSRLMS